MKQPRFTTVQDLFEAYSRAADDVGEADPGMGSLEFLQQLVEKRKWEPAISFCAYLLPKTRGRGLGLPVAASNDEPVQRG